MAWPAKNYLSFLDVMACGLGSLLFLFVVFVVIKHDLDFAVVPVEPQHREQAAPLVIWLIASDDKRACFGPGGGKWYLPDGYTAKTGSSGYFAALYAMAPPGAGEIRIGNWLTGVAVDIEIFYGDQRRRGRLIPEKSSANDDYRRLRVWPIPPAVQQQGGGNGQK